VLHSRKKGKFPETVIAPEDKTQSVVDNKKIKIDIGDPLPIESIALQKKDLYKKGNNNCGIFRN